MLTRCVLVIQPGDPLCICSVPGTDFEIVPPMIFNSRGEIRRAGVRDEELTRRMLQRFAGESVTTATARRIAGWLREGAP